MSKVLTIAGVSILALSLILGMAAPAMAAPEENMPQTGGFQVTMVRGEVLSIGDQEFVIQTGEDEFTIAVDDGTRYYQLAMPARIMALARHRVQLHQQNQLEMGNRAENGQGWVAQNRVRVAVGVRNQLQRMPLLKLCLMRGFCPFGGQAEFADIAVGDSVVVLADENNLARAVLIIKPTAYATVSGTITDISSSFITIDSDDGPQVTLSYDESTVFVLSGVSQLEEGQYVRIVHVDGIAKKVAVCPKAS